MSNHRDPWTPEDDARLAMLAANGRTHAQIARDMDRTPAAIKARQKWIRHGRPPRQTAAGTWTDAEDQQLITMTHEGRSVAECSTAIGRTQKAVTARRRQLRAEGRMSSRRQCAPDPERAKDDGPDFISRIRELGRMHGYRSGR